MSHAWTFNGDWLPLVTIEAKQLTRVFKLKFYVCDFTVKKINLGSKLKFKNWVFSVLRKLNRIKEPEKIINKSLEGKRDDMNITLLGDFNAKFGEKESCLVEERKHRKIKVDRSN